MSDSELQKNVDERRQVRFIYKGKNWESDVTKLKTKFLVDCRTTESGHPVHEMVDVTNVVELAMA